MANSVILPTPTGQQVGPGVFTAGPTVAQQIQQAYNQMLAKGDKQLAADWKTFAGPFYRKHPTLTFQQLVQAFLDTELAKGVGNAVQQVGGVLGQIPGAAAKGAENATNTINNLNPVSWLNSLGGWLASGIESGVIAVLKDVWKVVYPALEIGAGVLLVIVTFAFAFKDDLLKLAPLAAAAL